MFCFMSLRYAKGGVRKNFSLASLAKLYPTFETVVPPLKLNVADKAINPAGFWAHYNMVILTYLLTYLYFPDSHSTHCSCSS